MKNIGLFTFENLTPPDYDFKVYLDNAFAREAKNNYVDKQVQEMLNRSAFEYILLPLDLKMQNPYTFFRNFRRHNRLLVSNIKVDETSGLEASVPLMAMNWCDGNCMRYDAYNLKDERKALAAIALFQYWRDFAKSILFDNRTKSNKRK